MPFESPEITDDYKANAVLFLTLAMGGRGGMVAHLGGKGEEGEGGV